MPHKDKELKAAYQKRTATPYMRKWREKNRDKQREYSRTYNKKRRGNPEKRKMDKAAPGHKYQEQMSVAKWKGRIAAMSDLYIIGLLTRRKSLTKESITPEMINIHRKQLLIKRKLRSHDNNGN